MKFTLVTGGCGFVGRHVVGRLLRQGHPVCIVDDLSTGRRPAEWLPASYRPEIINEQVTRFNGSPPVIFIGDDVRSFLRTYRAGELEIKDVFHFAAVVGGRANIDRNPLAVAIDLSIDAELFHWAVTARPERLLFASSSAVYPVTAQTETGAVALHEDLVRFDQVLGQPDMTYGWAKLTGEYLARIAASHYGLHVACVRPFTGYGEDQHETYPVPAIAMRAARREDPLIIWGSGQQGRDFVHIEDCVDAIWLALDKIADGSAVNIGSGKLTSFHDVARKFAEIAGYQPRIQPLIDMPTGVHSRCADTERSSQLLGWRPKISSAEGFRRVYDAALVRVAAHVDKLA